MKVTETNFPTLSREQVQDLLAALEQGIPDDERVIALDRVLTNLDHSQIVPRNVEGVKADPPAIYYSTRPAILVNFDGDPVWSPIKDNDLKFAVNTNWDVFQHGVGEHHLSAPRQYLVEGGQPQGSVVGGRTTAGELCEAAEGRQLVGRRRIAARRQPSTAVPTVFVSTTPAELILVPGAPTYQAVAGTSLVWVSNTDADIFRLGAKGPVYFLVSGRWFSAPDFNGPWKFASLELPADFRKISLEHPRSRVLASVPGTPQAAEAVAARAACRRRRASTRRS